MITCPRCGFQAPDGSPYCPACGYGKPENTPAQPQVHNTPQPTQPPKKKKFSSWLLIAILAIVFIIWAVVGTNLQKRNDANREATRIQSNEYYYQTQTAVAALIPTETPHPTFTPEPTEIPIPAACDTFWQEVILAGSTLDIQGSPVSLNFDPDNNTCSW